MYMFATSHLTESSGAMWKEILTIDDLFHAAVGNVVW
jgi:hypothetical protein